MSQPKSLCVLRLSALGDCINAFGVIGALNKQYPDLKLSWVIDKRFAPLFKDEQGQDLVPLHTVDFKNQGLKTVLALKKELSSERFDILLNMQTSIKASLCSLAIKAQDKYGYDSERSREGQRFFINHQVPSPENKHVLSGFLAFAQSCNLPVDKPYWDFKLAPELIEKMQTIIGSDKFMALSPCSAVQSKNWNSCNLPVDKPYWDFKLAPELIEKMQTIIGSDKFMALSPCSAVQSKNWNIQGNIAMANYAYEQGFKVVLIGGPSQIEMQTCNIIAEQCPHCLNLCGKTNLRELAALLSLSSIVLSPDSGSMHLASALNTPVIGLFARHDDKRVGPWNFMDLNVSVYEQLAKQELNGQTIPWRYRVKQDQAMDNISINMVKEMFNHALATKVL